MTAARRLLLSLALSGPSKFSMRAAWLILIPQLVIYSYLLGPVFVYFTQGVPTQESLKVITGTWREEGKLGANRNGLTAPEYFIDTEQGAMKVHCGFPMQKRLCNIYYDSPPAPGHLVTAYYDEYFGILAFEDWTVPIDARSKANMSYTKGVLFFAQPKHTVKWNYHAHWMLAGLMFIYGALVYACWIANGKK